MTTENATTSIGPFAKPGNWYRGALHVHTNRSDGADTPEVVLARYKALGYDFVVLTDHNRVTVCEAPEGLLLIPGVELHYVDSTRGKQWHFVGIGFEGEPRTEWTSPEQVPGFLRSRCAFMTAAHPYWSNLSGEDLHPFEQCDAVEVFNTLCQVEIARGSSEPVWDNLLAYGSRLKGVAVDDTHQRRTRVDLGGAWVMVKAAELKAKAVLDALRAGEYYSSTGPEIVDWAHRGDTYFARTSPARTISFMANTWFGRRFAAPAGGTIAEAQYTLGHREVYLRLQVTDAQGRRAWSNPVCF